MMKESSGGLVSQPALILALIQLIPIFLQPVYGCFNRWEAEEKLIGLPRDHGVDYTKELIDFYGADRAPKDPRLGDLELMQEELNDILRAKNERYGRKIWSYNDLMQATFGLLADTKSLDPEKLCIGTSKETGRILEVDEVIDKHLPIRKRRKIKNGFIPQTDKDNEQRSALAQVGFGNHKLVYYNGLSLKRSTITNLKEKFLSVKFSQIGKRTAVGDYEERVQAWVLKVVNYGIKYWYICDPEISKFVDNPEVKEIIKKTIISEARGFSRRRPQASNLIELLVFDEKIEPLRFLMARMDEESYHQVFHQVVENEYKDCFNKKQTTELVNFTSSFTALQHGPQTVSSQELGRSLISVFVETASNTEAIPHRFAYYILEHLLHSESDFKIFFKSEIRENFLESKIEYHKKALEIEIALTNL